MKFAYADPPYIGCAKAHYGNDPICAEVDHVELIGKLQEYDAWVLSLSSTSLKYILSICPSGARVAAWVKPFCSFKPNVNPAYAWEPVIFMGSRKRNRQEKTIRDFHSEPITLRKGVHGKKPESFCFWIFDLINAQPEDEFHDLFPGSGGVTRAWGKWRLVKSLQPNVNVDDYLEQVSDSITDLELDLCLQGGDGK